MSWIQDIVNFIFPAECHICGNSLAPHEKFICAHCLQELPRTGYHRNPKNPMVERFAGQFPFVSATGHFFYSRESSLAQLIQDMKYRGFYSIGTFLGRLSAEELLITGYFNDIDYIVPVPMHFSKKLKRGYNQTDYIARGISEICGIPVLNLLKMIKRRRTQTALNRHQRLSNAENLFKVMPNFNLTYKSILLVDDVCTTGATIASAAKTITDKFPGVRLYLFTLGVTF